jgi:transcriptional regulator with XRE-family HTH domain
LSYLVVAFCQWRHPFRPLAKIGSAGYHEVWGPRVTETVGQRLVRLRQERRLTQAQLAEAVGLSHSYVSLIEADKRTPTRRVLQRLAESLGCTVDRLLTGRGDEKEVLELELGFAELALRSGDAVAARSRYADVLERARAAALPEIAAPALYGLSMARETLGDLPAAIRGFQQLADDPDLPSTVHRVTVLMMLCRTSMAIGDMTRAVQVGELALHEHRASGQPMTESFIELVVTLVGCYYERGDVSRAQVLIDGAVSAAERLGSPVARASAYWNAALVAEGEGDLSRARKLIDRALAIYGELDNAWALAMLRSHRGRLLLCEERPSLVEARPLLEKALAELEHVGTPGDASEAEADLARCHLLAGELAEAVEVAQSAVERAQHGSVLASAKARIALGDALTAVGDVNAAVVAYRTAAEELDAIGASRRAAAAWRQVALALTRLGRVDEAYEELADAIGVSTPITSASLGNTGR